ncbi:PorV/PorQ family protein [candidate division TA06 bacterium]|uniref:PorV/PorQ family protein n=1 Tax=candidate division TA06 bacterium TaxID=2250710 RepID=A0A933IBA8_UNCT6|nr:PorV/PorQ family protein [candidate division TA06 bacterium]
MLTTKIKLFLTTAIILSSTAPAWAISEGGAIFLLIRPGARPSGMGSAFCAIADDATATYYNPAGLAFLKRNDPRLNSHDIRDWNRFLNSFKNLPERNVFSRDDFKDPEGMVIKLSGTPLLCISDIADWNKLIAALADTAGLAGKNILPLLNEDARAIITGHQAGDSLDSQAKANLAYALNKQINGRAVYKTISWGDIAIPEQATEVLAKYRMRPDSLGFAVSNIVDPQVLAQKIKGRANPVSQYIYGQMTGKAKIFLSRKYQDSHADSLKSILAAALNNVCRQSDFYKEQRFKNVALKPETSVLADKSLKGGALYSWNQDLLLQAYPDLLKLQTAELSQEDMRLLNRVAMESLLNRTIILNETITPYKAFDMGDSLAAYIQARTKETIGQIFLQYAGEGPLAEAEQRLWLDEINNNVLSDSQLVRQPAPGGRNPSQHLQNLMGLGSSGNTAVLNRALLAEYYPEWFVASQKKSNPFQYLKGLMGPKALAELDNHFNGQGVPIEGRQLLLAEINLSLSRTDFYQQEQWANNPFPVEAQELLAEGPGNLSQNDLRKLNRMLLEALYPSDLVKIGKDKSYASLMHSPWLSDIWADVGDMYYEYISYVQPYKDWGVFGGNVIFISEGTSQHTGPNSENYGEFSSYEFSPSLSYGNEIFKDLAGGVNLKLIHSHLAPFGAPGEEGTGVATTWALDFGLLYRGPFKGLSFGANLQNIGPKLEYIDAEQADPLSRNLRVGTAYKILDGRWAKLTAAYDITKMLVVNDRPWREELEETVSHLGFEYSYMGAASLSLRYGLVYDRIGRIGTDDKGNFDLGPANTFGAGVGYRNITFDFSLEPGGELQKYNKKFSLSVEL